MSSEKPWPASASGFELPEHLVSGPKEEVKLYLDALAALRSLVAHCCSAEVEAISDPDELSSLRAHYVGLQQRLRPSQPDLCRQLIDEAQEMRRLTEGH